MNCSRNILLLARRFNALAACATVAAVVQPSSAAIIGTNAPGKPLTAARVAGLPSALQPAWKKYLARSKRQHRADEAVLRKELRDHGLRHPLVPPPVRRGGRLPLNKPEAWYGTTEAHRIAKVVISFQTPAGGWSKNLDMADEPRVPGMEFAPNNGSRFLRRSDFDRPMDAGWSYVGTFDNRATVTPLRFLAKVIAASGAEESGSYRAAFERGLDYIFAAQYPNGGWPQVWPLQGGYHDAITYNDNAMINILELLQDVANGTNDCSFVPPRTRARAAASVKRGVACILATQIVANGRRTVWCQQHDPLTLRPTAARNYEMPSQAAAESADVMTFLMQLPNPDARVVAAVHAAAAWFERVKIPNASFRYVAGHGRLLVPAPGAGPLWSRYYQIGTDRPIFGDRDKTIHDRLDEISSERRRGYAWYGNAPARALREYAAWRQSHPLSPSNSRN